MPAQTFYPIKLSDLGSFRNYCKNKKPQPIKPGFVYQLN